MQDRPKSKSTNLYDTDFHVWCHEQARLLRNGELVALDVENLAEELESMGRSDKHQIRNRMEVLVAHLLKWRYQPGARSASWRATIREQRSRIAMVVEDSPSLAGYPASIAVDCYNAARLAASGDTGIDFTLFPENCPFTTEEILDTEFLPKEPDSIDPG